ncbi:hypothetical protein BEP19_04000 [Ammoniphilus oxalaticus]|uniref:Uncharacterized protein n=1 Tax=Ammoniphilus oxalaticus TaxID=66863 RepID=A0A419SLW5_9BACL|nr:hypothetical protein [Ammoniphilus oxalaticus]RKD25005.1 hypothetical protein BEP19_04000 [Ammoniphilus oxalaticus]
MLKQGEPIVYQSDSGKKIVIQLFHDSSNRAFHVLEKQESELNLYEDNTDCQGEYVVFPSKGMAFLIEKLNEDNGVVIDGEQDSLYLYSKKNEILEYKGLYKDFNVIWDRQNPNLHKRFAER